jgi:hypothetical protein
VPHLHAGNVIGHENSATGARAESVTSATRRTRAWSSAMKRA